MADIVAGFLGPALEVAGWVAAPIIRQLNYLCCFTTNITTLEKEAEELQVTAADLKVEVDRAKDHLRVITSKVETWLQKSEHIIDEKDKICELVPKVGSGCLKIRARFSLSKRAKKTTDLMKVLRDQCEFDAHDISLSPPPAARQPVPLERTYEFESRKQIEEDIMETLRLGDVNMIGICGMGGLGKTTMAKKVMNRALEENVFDEVVMVVVSQAVDKSRVQFDIGGSLGLQLEGENWQTRVQKLHARLSGTKRILLVLDDVWEKLMLEDLGIPTNHTGCTILLTSRNRDSLSDIDGKYIFGMQVLSKDDAWFLFRERAGTCVDDRKLNSIAKQVVNECEGLPIALASVGATLRNVMNVGIWKDALRQLEQAAPNAELKKDVYNPLKLSYDFLDSMHKSVFLLCCLYPEDAHIPLERLTYYCMGLGIFEGGIGDVEKARNNMRAMTHTLKSRSLLLDSRRGDEYVKMHDVVRDVCVFIAKQEGYIGDNDCIWMSSSERFDFPTELGFPNLRLLLWNDYSANKEFKPDGRFPEGISDLHVLSIEKNNLFTSLPLPTQSLQNLKTLVLDWCWRLEALYGVVELVNLEILICRNCDSIKELPPEIKELNKLKVLDLTSCRNLQRIGRGIISSLVGLEELKMSESFKKWEADDREERENAALRELEALTNLRCLEIDIEDPTLVAENMLLSSKLEIYYIRFSELTAKNKFDYHRSNKRMDLLLGEERCIGDWIESQLLRDTECLLLEGNGANKVDFTKLENIRLLVLRECESMKKIGTSLTDDCEGATVLSTVEHLMLNYLPKLEEIRDSQISSNFFQNLKELQLWDLPALKQVWEDSSRGVDYLFPQLQILSIKSCEIMERVFFWKGEDKNEDTSIQSPNSYHITTKILPKLEQLELSDLPNLTSFYQGIQGIEFPRLRSVGILKSGKLKVMVSKGKECNENNLGGSRSKAQIQDLHGQPQEMSFGCLKELSTDWSPFCGCKIDVSLFNGLEKLTIVGYDGSMSIVTPSIAENLFNLKILHLKYCDEMVQVIEDDEDKLVSGGGKTLLFPRLQSLVLFRLRKLVSFCEWKCDVELPSLRELDIMGCDNMKNFTLGLLDSPNLKCVLLDSYYGDLGVAKDLNEMLQQHYFTRAKEKQEEEKKGSEQVERVCETEEERNP